MKYKDKHPTIDVRNLIDESLESYKANPVDLLNIGDAEGEYHYLLSHVDEYERTVQDVVGYLTNNNHDRSSIKILEIGSFLGLVSIVLSRLNFNVTATDIEEFISCPTLRQKFNEFNVEWKSCNLRINRLPFNDDEYDVVIMCETLEHLNFNPLPVIGEINRILRRNGLLYLTLPNIARLDNRLRLLRGQSIHNKIDDFFEQLDMTKGNMIVSLHWREYTTAEIKEMLERLGFTMIQQKYDSAKQSRPTKIQLKKAIRKLVYRTINMPFVQRIIYNSLVDPDDPNVHPTQINLAVKKMRSDTHFQFTDATTFK